MTDILDRNPHFRDKITGKQMVRMDFKPERLNGQDVRRGVFPDTSGVNIPSRTILFPAKAVQGVPPIVHLDQQVENFMARLITVSNTIGDPVLKAQVVAFSTRIKRAARAALYRSALIERERLKQALAHQSMPHAVAVIEGTPLNG